jgi:site-specific recombinase XerD
MEADMDGQPASYIARVSSQKMYPKEVTLHTLEHSFATH